MRLKTMVILTLSLTTLAGCDDFNKLRSDTMFAKKNSEGVACTYTTVDGLEFDKPWKKHYWSCPQTAAERTLEVRRKERELSQHLASTVENYRIKSLLASKEFISNRDKEPLRSFLNNAKKDGRITFGELATINEMLEGFKQTPPQPTKEELEAKERLNLVSKL